MAGNHQLRHAARYKSTSHYSQKLNGGSGSWSRKNPPHLWQGGGREWTQATHVDHTSKWAERRDVEQTKCIIAEEAKNSEQVYWTDRKMLYIHVCIRHGKRISQSTNILLLQFTVYFTKRLSTHIYVPLWLSSYMCPPPPVPPPSRCLSPSDFANGKCDSDRLYNVHMLAKLVATICRLLNVRFLLENPKKNKFSFSKETWNCGSLHMVATICWVIYIYVE